MNEDGFDRLLSWQNFGTDEALRIDAQWRRCATLGQALWGRTAEDLKRQLTGSHPEVPPNFDLGDYRRLEQSAERISAAVGGPRFAWMSPSPASTPTITVGNRQFTAWEARCEIVRRAIAYLEKPPRD